MAIGGGSFLSEEDKKYCKYCGKLLVKVHAGTYDEYTGEKVYKKECHNTSCSSYPIRLKPKS